METQVAYEPKRLHRYDRVLVPMTSDLIGWSDNYLPHFERLPTEVQHSLICHFERLSMNRFLAARERTAAQ
jgi:hypothetical protein